MSTRFSWVAMFVLVTTGALSAPGQPPAPAAQQDAMKKLDFLVGQWKGEGWMDVAGQRRTFKGTEVVQRKLDGLLLAIEGLHRGQVGEKGEEGIVHNAFALVSYDDKAKRYRLQAFTSRGAHEDGEATVSEGKLVWGMKVPQFGEIRFTIKLDDMSRWFETGEVSRDGKTWQQFFEMTLRRAEAK
jgi:hypothetical protein